ncbi:MAG: 3-phosphoshikimate 1-carboxyvinyltransferase, partial [Caldilineaceae bacterium]|nr:3-phosphoshikimate 1-carboxyvinyltransferase [Caldilineaceae bacterium]
MLASMGAPINTYGRKVTSERPSTPLHGLDLTVPGDVSSAAFLIVAAAITPDSRITINGVGINPTRIGIIDTLCEMGAQIAFKNERDAGGEPVADIEVSYSTLLGVTVGGEQIVTMIDELPVLAVAATQAEGRTVVRDAHELRVKETDRIATTVSELRKLGARIEPTADGFIIDGPTPLTGAPTEGHGDHRLAMAMTVAGLVSSGQTMVYGAEVTGDSFPGFEVTLQALGAQLQVAE